ncbi:monofunctional biosynthetic peptidoglycan transglycosylase [Robbsia andropogonis]
MATRSPRRRWLTSRVMRVLTLLLVAWCATQVFYLASIVWWRFVDPGSTAYMRAGSWRMAHDGDHRSLEHEWVPYDAISINLKRAVVASEDATFVDNPGFDTEAMMQAWDRNQRAGRVARGGSTITQQLARNLFLSSEKSYIRKGQELIITGMLDMVLDKRRILEIYLNSVEWGNGVYGAEAAARHYFHVSAARLSAAQAARLAVMLPDPRYYDAHPGSPYLRQRTGVIQARMNAVTVPR